MPHLIPQPIALALALVEINREGNDVVEWSEELDDIAASVTHSHQKC